MSEFDTNAYRRALCQFATGVTVVTARGADGTPVGVTASSFNSVSLDPPLVLWSLAKSSRSMAVFESSDAFAVHILAAEQEHLSDRFASRANDKFAGLDVGDDGPPLLAGCAARFLCATVHRYEGGDHIIFVGKVTDFESSGRPPLLYHGGDYAEKRRRMRAQRAKGSDEPAERFITHLLMRAARRAAGPLGGELAARDLSERQYLMLALIGEHDGLNSGELASHLGAAEEEAVERDLDLLARRGWIETRREAVILSDSGREMFIDMVSIMKGHEDHMLMVFSDAERAELEELLSRLVDRL